MSFSKYGCCPTGEGLDLLRAALHPNVELALQCWSRWRLKNTLEECDLRMHRLMPIIYRRFQRRDLQEHDYNILRGVYRFHWTRNQVILNQARAVLLRLAENGIPTILLKGVSLLLDDYKDVGARPMWDFDILIEPHRRDQALTLLQSCGWQLTHPPLPELHIQHGCGLRNPEGQEMDLHWYCMDESRWAAADDDLWACSRSFWLSNELEARRLCPEHSLLHVCVHGAKASGDSFGWVCDAIHIVRSHELDYRVLLWAARQRGVVPTLTLALSYLSEVMGLSVPDGVLEELRQTPVGLVDRLYFRCKARSSHGLSFWAEPVLDYVRTVERANPLGFVCFLRSRWRLKSLRQLPGHALSRVWNRFIHRRHP
jgi:hypothetical protein